MDIQTKIICRHFVKYKEIIIISLEFLVPTLLIRQRSAPTDSETAVSQVLHISVVPRVPGMRVVCP
jgi:hypothetical protein